ncbi:MAG: hypothetical protein U9N62_00150, partial [Thermotogota bacterium]|nr:hypothetical protein [Thermotogota bacterium]
PPSSSLINIETINRMGEIRMTKTKEKRKSKKIFTTIIIINSFIYIYSRNFIIKIPNEKKLIFFRLYICKAKSCLTP